MISIPHAGVEIPRDIETRLVSPWLARKDTDWWMDRLYERAGMHRANNCADGDLADGHRRQPRPVRPLALSGPGNDRALPEHDV